MPFASDLLRGALARGGAGLGKLAGRAYGKAAAANMPWSRAIGGDILRNIGAGVGGISKMSDAGMWATVGALGGAGYGAFSEDTSVLGGALMGAGIGFGGVASAKLGRVGMGAYRAARAGGLRRGAAASMGMQAIGSHSRSFIGSSYSRAVNGIKSTLSGRFGL